MLASIFLGFKDVTHFMLALAISERAVSEHSLYCITNMSDTIFQDVRKK